MCPTFASSTDFFLQMQKVADMAAISMLFVSCSAFFWLWLCKKLIYSHSLLSMREKREKREKERKRKNKREKEREKREKEREKQEKREKKRGKEIKREKKRDKREKS